MDKIRTQLIELMTESIPDKDLNSVTYDDRLIEDVGLDSLNMMLTAIVIEDKFHFTFPSGSEPKTFGDLCRMIAEHTEEC